MTVRVLLADDQDLVRGGFSMILSAHEDIVVVGEAGDGSEAVRLATERAPDVVLMDVRMPRMDGIEATRRISATTAARVLVLTTFDLDEYVYDALRAGASGFLLKDMRRDELVAAVRTVAAGDALLAPSVTRRLIAHVVAHRPDAGGSGGTGAGGRAVAAGDGNRPGLRAADRGPGSLTARETETLRQVARGLSNAEIAAEMVVSEHTVKTHVSNVLAKLGLRDRVQAVVVAYESGLVIPGTSEA